MKYQHEQNTLDVTKAKEMAGIETDKFKNMVSSIGSDTIQAIATAGPEMQVCTLLLTGYNLQTVSCFYPRHKLTFLRVILKLYMHVRAIFN